MGMLAPDHGELYEAFAPYLEAGEKVTIWTYGVQQSVPLFLLAFCVTSIPAALVTAMLVGTRAGILGSVIFFFLWWLTMALPIKVVRKDYVLGLTDHRLMIVRLKTPLLRLNPAARREFRSYPLDTLPQVDVSFGRLKTRIKINDGQNRIAVDAGRFGMAGNYDSAVALAEALTNRPIRVGKELR